MIGTNNYGMPYKTRKPATQVWAVGETVKVGFMTLRIVGKDADGWCLVNKDATKKYRQEPHQGCYGVDSF